MKKYTKFTKYGIAAAVAIVVAVPAIGGLAYASGKYGDCDGHGMMGRKGHMQKIVSQIDVNADGTIERAELESWQQKMISDADGNGDGKIDLNEFETIWLMQMRSHMVDKFQHLDDDGDATITLSEIVTPTNNMFDRFDRNEDGQISPKEMRKRFKRHHHDDDDD